jgi:hypothetical protein
MDYRRNYCQWKDILDIKLFFFADVAWFLSKQQRLGSDLSA